VGAIVALVVLVCLVVPVPYVIVSPGPVFNTLGDIDGAPIITIEGATTYPTDGALDMTTVRERGGPYGPLTVAEAVVAALGSSSLVVPTEVLFPPGATDEETRARGAVEFLASQSNAVAAALGELGQPVGESPIVASVDPAGSAGQTLRTGDVVRAVDGAPVDGVQAFIDRVRQTSPGSELALELEREGDTITVDVPVGASPDDPGQGQLGVSVRPLFTAPFTIDFELSGIGGPSAGLIFALALVDELTPGQLTAGRQVAGTGTISPDGTVGAIGGVVQKMIGARRDGAELFLVPVANCEAVVGNEPEGLTVAAVENLDDAIEAMDQFSQGQTPTGCAAVAAAQ